MDVSEIASLDSGGLAAYLNSIDLFVEACKWALRAPRDGEYDISIVEQFATRHGAVVASSASATPPQAGAAADGGSSPSGTPTTAAAGRGCERTHPAVTAFVIRQSVTGQDFVAPGFVPDLLLPYLENVLGQQSLSLTALVGSTTEKKAQAFDASPDSETLLLFLEAMIDRRAEGIDEPLDYCVRSLALLHYAVRVTLSGKVAPEPSAPSTANTSPSSHVGGGGGGTAHSPAGAAAASRVKPLAGMLSEFDSNGVAVPLGAGGGGRLPSSGPDAFFPSGSIASLPQSPMARQATGGGLRADADDRGPPLPKQEPLSGTRRVHRKWDQWLQIGKRAFFENSNLPVVVDGVSYTACACFTEALEDFLASALGRKPAARRPVATTAGLDGAAALGGGSAAGAASGARSFGDDFLAGLGDATAAAAPAASAVTVNMTTGGGRNLFGDGGWDVAATPLNLDGSPALPPPPPDSPGFLSGGGGTVQLTSEQAAEAELWNLLSQSIPVGGSAVTVMGEMHTKESAMAMAVSADVENADRWLDLARLLPSETGKKRISKRKQHKSSPNQGRGNGRNSNNNNSGNGNGNNNGGASGRNLNLGAGFGSPLGPGSPSPARGSAAAGSSRKLGLAFDDFATPAASKATPAAAAASGADDFMNPTGGAGGESRRSTTTREVVPTVDGRAVNRVQAYAESLKLSDKRAFVWSELGLHMPLHPPYDALFIGNTSYNSKRCHEVALERDASLADSWLDLGWQLMEDKRTTVIGGRVLGATECFVNALCNVPSDLGEAWSLLAQSLDDRADAMVHLPETREDLSKIDCFRRALEVDPQCISAWIGLGRMLPRGSSTVVHGKTFTQLGLFYHALEMDDSDAVAWNGLGAMLGPVDKAVFRGETYSRRQCYLRALDCDPTLARVWNNLGLDLGDSRVPKDRDAFGNDIVTGRDGRNYIVFNGRKYDNKACFTRALHCEGGNVSTSWVNLGMLLDADPKSENGTVVVHGKPANKARCYMEAVKANESNAIAWNNLGAVMGPHETVVINKHPCTKLDCYRNALEVDESLSNAWYNAVCVMVRTEKERREHGGSIGEIAFKVRGRNYSKIGCALRAVEVNPENGNGWKMLSDLMKEDGVSSYKDDTGKKISLSHCLKMLEKYPPKDG